MPPQNKPDRIRILFDDHRLVANAGLLLPATLARHLGLRELVDHHLDLGGAPGRANTGDKMLKLVASALAGGDCIDDADALRAGGTVGVLGCVVKAPSTLGTFLRSFRWGHVRQLDRVSRQLLAPLSIDLDSTICETYGLAKEGARHHGYTGARGYHPLLAIAAGTGEVLMSRLRDGRANAARGAAHFLRETVGRVRYGGARGQLTVRADSGFYAHTVVAACREMDVRFSITIRQRASLRDLIEAIPEDDWTPIPYWMDGAADVAEINGLPPHTRGVLLVGIVPADPADRAGLMEAEGTTTVDGVVYPVDGDVITAIDGIAVNGIDDLVAHMAEYYRPGDTVTLDVITDGVPEQEDREKARVAAPIPDRARIVAWANQACIVQGRASNSQEMLMEQEAIYVGIDVAKAQVDVAVRPTGDRWEVSYNEAGVRELVSQMEDLGPAMVLPEASGGLELRW